MTVGQRVCPWEKEENHFFVSGVRHILLDNIIFECKWFRLVHPCIVCACNLCMQFDMFMSLRNLCRPVIIRGWQPQPLSQLGIEESDNLSQSKRLLYGINQNSCTVHGTVNVKTKM